MPVPTPDDQSQGDKFKKAARDLECDDDEARWTERLKKVAKPNASGKQR